LFFRDFRVEGKTKGSLREHLLCDHQVVSVSGSTNYHWNFMFQKNSLKNNFLHHGNTRSVGDMGRGFWSRGIFLSGFGFRDISCKTVLKHLIISIGNNSVE